MRADLIWRGAVALAALVVLLVVGAGTAAGVLALAGLVLATERLVALRRTGLADRVLVGVGGLVVALVLTGLALDAVGTGLRPTSWTLAVVVLSVAGLVVAAVLPPRAAGPAGAAGAAGVSVWREHRRTALLTVPWAAVAVVVAVVSVRMSATSLSAADEPPLQMSFGSRAGTDVEVVVSSTDAVGPLELRTSAGDEEISYPLFDLGHDGSRTTTVALPRTGRFVVTLSYPDQTQPLRTLVLDR